MSKKQHNELIEKTNDPQAATVAYPAVRPTAVEATPAAEAPSMPEVLTPEQIAELKAKAAKAEEHWNRLLRQSADFDNFKKRAARERLEAIQYANEGLLEKLIPVLDHFEAGLAAAGDSQDPAVQALKTGIAMVFNQLKSTLAEAGLEEIDASGQAFDPHLHEAISQQETGDMPEGHVVHQLRKGYKLRDRLLRPASVVVAQHPGA
jgi:molecular chaperone GrpE